MQRAWLLSLGLLGVAVAEPAWAQQVETCDLECPRGTSCEVIHPCFAILCPEDDPDCAGCDGPGTPVCAPAACETDSDCDDSMKCFEFRDDCAPDPLEVPSPGDEANTCQPSTSRQCVVRWQLPCDTDSDCGAGFHCEEGESCGVPRYDPSSGEPQNTEVTCSPTGTFSCVVIETACNTAADCPAAFDCIDNPNGTCSSGPDGQTECTTPDPARLCAPRVVGSPSVGGNVAVATAGEAAPAPGLANETADAPAAAREGGCSLLATTPASPFALLSTLGLGLALVTRRRRANAR